MWGSAWSDISRKTMKLAQLHRRNHPASRPAPQRRSLGVYAHPLRSFADDLEMHPIVRAKLRTNVPHGRDDDTGKRTSCSCGGTCPHCRAQAMRRAMTERPTPRPAGTDNLEETDLTVPRAGDAGVRPTRGRTPGRPRPRVVTRRFPMGSLARITAASFAAITSSIPACGRATCRQP